MIGPRETLFALRLHDRKPPPRVKNPAEAGMTARHARKLTGDDISYYQKIVVALNETIRIMADPPSSPRTHGATGSRSAP